jgi:DNA-binding NarL/FixJ family response regulator
MNNNSTNSIAWMKETLLLLAFNRLSISEHIDVILGIKSALEGNILSKEHFVILREYLYGYTSDEIAERYKMTLQEIESILFDSIRKLSVITGYEDVKLINRAHRDKNIISKIVKFKKFLIDYSWQFNVHTIKG